MDDNRWERLTGLIIWAHSVMTDLRAGHHGEEAARVLANDVPPSSNEPQWVFEKLDEDEGGGDVVMTRRADHGIYVTLSPTYIFDDRRVCVRVATYEISFPGLEPVEGVLTFESPGP